jgi:hypothetical protein
MDFEKCHLCGQRFPKKHRLKVYCGPVCLKTALMVRRLVRSGHKTGKITDQVMGTLARLLLTIPSRD